MSGLAYPIPIAVKKNGRETTQGIATSFDYVSS
jgi:hypothetical protein